MRRLLPPPPAPRRGEVASVGAEEWVSGEVEVEVGVGDLGMDITALILMLPLRPTSTRVLTLHTDGENLSLTGEG